mgnify:CR=1 FL=1
METKRTLKKRKWMMNCKYCNRKIFYPVSIKTVTTENQAVVAGRTVTQDIKGYLPDTCPHCGHSPYSSK